MVSRAKLKYEVEQSSALRSGPTYCSELMLTDTNV